MTDKIPPFDIWCRSKYVTGELKEEVMAVLGTYSADLREREEIWREALETVLSRRRRLIYIPGLFK